MNEPQTDENTEFDVAVSFAGEQREFVEEYKSALVGHGFTVFFDEDRASESWGEELPEYFENVYQRRARYVAIFISKDYAEKSWTIHERRVALSRALEMRRAYVLPIRMDDTVLPGLRSTVSYLDARRLGMAGLVAATRDKLQGTVTNLSNPDGGRVPRARDAINKMINDRPQVWEYRLFAGALRVGIDERNRKYLDHTMGLAKRNGQVLNENQAVDLLIGGLMAVTEIMGNLERMLSVETQAKAFGDPGEEGDPDRIIHLTEPLSVAR